MANVAEMAAEAVTETLKPMTAALEAQAQQIAQLTAALEALQRDFQEQAKRSPEAEVKAALAAATAQAGRDMEAHMAAQEEASRRHFSEMFAQVESISDGLRNAVEKQAAEGKEQVNSLQKAVNSSCMDFIFSGWQTLFLIVLVLAATLGGGWYFSHKETNRINEAAGNLWQVQGAAWYNGVYGGNLQPEEFPAAWEKITKDKKDHPENYPRLQQNKK